MALAVQYPDSPGVQNGQTTINLFISTSARAGSPILCHRFSVLFGLVEEEVTRWVEEIETADQKMESSAGAPDKQSFVEDDHAFKVAKKMLSAYIAGEFEHSVRLREVIANGGQEWMDKRCATLAAKRIRIKSSNLKQFSEPKGTKRKATEPALSPKPTKIRLIHTKGDKPSKPVTIRLIHTPKPTPKIKLVRVRDTEPFPEYKEPTLDELQAFTDSLLWAAGHNQLSGFNVISSSPSSSTDGIATSSASASTSDSEEITNVRPLRAKPDFKFKPSSIAGKLPGFLAAMKAANEELAANPSDRRLELEDGEDDDRERIEMELGLGVLEEIKKEDEPLKLSK